MKSTGIVRKIDKLGRIVLPKELRKVFGIEDREPLEMFIDEDCIILKKYEASCVFCGSQEELEKYRDKNICKNCIEAFKSQS